MTHRFRRRVARVAVTVVAVAALAACSGSSDEEADTASQTAGDAAAATSAGPGAGDTPQADLAGLPDVVATVNGEDIDQEEFVSAYQPQFDQAAAQAQQAGSDVEQGELKQQTLDFMVNNLLLRQAADEAGVEIAAAEVDADIAELATSNGAASTADFFTALEEQGFSEDEVRAEVENQLKIEKYLTDTSDVEQPSGDDIRALYDELSAQQEASGEDSTDAAAPTIPPFDEVQAELEQQLLSEAQSEAVDGILSDLRGDADITSNL